MYVHILRSTNKLQGIGVAIEKEGLETDWPNCTAGETTGPGEKKSCFFSPAVWSVAYQSCIFSTPHATRQ